MTPKAKRHLIQSVVTIVLLVILLATAAFLFLGYLIRGGSCP